MPETLREKATKKLQGPDANPSQLGDPISIKAEQSNTIPTKQEGGAIDASESPSRDSKQSSKNSKGNANGDGETLREKATKEPQGPNANPSQLGDPISLKAETSDYVPTDEEDDPPGEEERTRKKDSKL
ncbi:hypothetical protein F5Y00DRAFT_102094 [Daldinia vernicosa]|uniref:uncharacterized protein n=1 Tax=Daldinia vernicosa TaxID=114800 RepID=UPI002008777A|nr:uncharacterized protein F5Y00DRAFT_102094 [Daldinia vernicosa]KAI0853482.1 hypothetical protein F5Y00DRAFT_102094 [Daldinia vernicosa]